MLEGFKGEEREEKKKSGKMRELIGKKWDVISLRYIYMCVTYKYI